MNNIVDLQVAVKGKDLPELDRVSKWIDTVLSNQELDEQELTVRIVSSEESQSLNHQYRQKDKPTNVLSFPFEAPPGIEINLLGDLVICADLVEREANEQNKAVFDHWAHLVVHGTLHLLGFDHENEQEAQQMEQLEVELLAKLGIDDPYKDH